MRSHCVVLSVKYSWSCAGLGNFNKLNLLWRNIGCQSPHQRTPCRFRSLTCLGYVSSWHYRGCRIYHFKIFLITPAKSASSFTEKLISGWNDLPTKQSLTKYSQLRPILVTENDKTDLCYWESFNFYSSSRTFGIDTKQKQFCLKQFPKWCECFVWV